MIARTDRAGAGSIDDKPLWSPSGQYVLLPTYGTPSGPYLVRAAVDGSSSAGIGYDPGLAQEEWYDAPPFSAFWVSDTGLLASVSLLAENAGLGGPTDLVLFRLNEARDTIVAGETLGDGTLIGWDVPGQSVWVQREDGMHSIPLPEV
jgi:hypothetical protein